MHPFRIGPMAIADLRGFIRALEKRGELVRVKAKPIHGSMAQSPTA